MFELEDLAAILIEQSIPFLQDEYRITLDGPYVIITKDNHSDEVDVCQSIYSFYQGYTYTVVALLDQTDVSWKFVKSVPASSSRGISAHNVYLITRKDGSFDLTIAFVNAMGPNDDESESSFHLVDRYIDISSHDDWTPGSILSVTAYEAERIVSVQIEDYASEPNVRYY